MLLCDRDWDLGNEQTNDFMVSSPIFFVGSTNVLLESSAVLCGYFLQSVP